MVWNKVQIYIYIFLQVPSTRIEPVILVATVCSLLSPSSIPIHNALASSNLSRWQYVLTLPLVDGIEGISRRTGALDKRCILKFIWCDPAG